MLIVISQAEISRYTKMLFAGPQFEPPRENYYIPGQNLEPPRAKRKSYYIPGQKMKIAIYQARNFEPADAP